MLDHFVGLALKGLNMLLTPTEDTDVTVLLQGKYFKHDI